MDKETKRTIGLVLLGSAVAVAGISLYLYFDKDARESIESMINREKAKLFVKHHLNGSENMIEAVDNLSDKEVNVLVKLSESANKIKDDVTGGFDNIVKKARNMSDHLGDRVSNYF